MNIAQQLAEKYPGIFEFFWHNRRLIKEIEALEHRSRRPDVLVDDDFFIKSIILSAIISLAFAVPYSVLSNCKFSVFRIFSISFKLGNSNLN